MKISWRPNSFGGISIQSPREPQITSWAMIVQPNECPFKGSKKPSKLPFVDGSDSHTLPSSKRTQRMNSPRFHVWLVVPKKPGADRVSGPLFLSLKVLHWKLGAVDFNKFTTFKREFFQRLLFPKRHHDYGQPFFSPFFFYARAQVKNGFDNLLRIIQECGIRQHNQALHITPSDVFRWDFLLFFIFSGTLPSKYSLLNNVVVVETDVTLNSA